MTWTDLLELVMESDANGDGTIDLGEFIELMKRKSSETDQMEVSNCFFQIQKTETVTY
jgi:Ca2+-binding EF-hand superfamily protein